ncbi:MAG: LrgB family protein [Geminicoccaceae bacterium]|nr:MAG: LrgB family protein [Geminicoccaceae bacterium]
MGSFGRRLAHLPHRCRRGCPAHRRGHGPARLGAPAATPMMELYPLPFDTGLAWLLFTLAAFWLGTLAYTQSAKHPVLNPMIVAGLLVVPALLLTDTAYATYAESVEMLRWLTGPAIVALAVPLYQSLTQVRQAFFPALVVIVLGASVAMASGAVAMQLLGADLAVILAMTPKSVTTPVAMEIAGRLGALEAVTALFVLTAGVTGALTANAVCHLFGIQDHRVHGLVLGVTAHVLGVARGYSISPEMGTFAAVGMGITAILAALLLPPIAAFVL